MRIRISAVALAAALACAPTVAAAFDDCPPDSAMDGYTCTMLTGENKGGAFYRITIPSDWDGDLVVINHGFDLNDKNIRPHEVCSNNVATHCEADIDCGGDNYCNNISYMGLEEILLPMGKAVAASTYRESGWAVFHSSKDLKEMIDIVRKDDTFGDQLERVIVTGFSLGGAVTADATLKLKIHGAFPLCGAVAGGLPTWDVAQDVRLVYDFICDDVPGAGGLSPAPKFASEPDVGEPNGVDSDDDATTMALKVNTCFGNLFPSGDVGEAAAQAARLADFIALTGFSGGTGLNVALAMGFATLGLGDFVNDDNRLKGKRIGFNEDPALDYSTIGVGGPLAAEFNTDVKRLTKGKGRSKLRKVSTPDFTKGKGKKVEFPILSIGGAADWLVIPEFQTVYEQALINGDKLVSLVWQDEFGHCEFTEFEMRATVEKYFEWLGPLDGPNGAMPTTASVEAACVAAGGVIDDTCMFDATFVPGEIYDRIPPREDWPAAAKP